MIPVEPRGLGMCPIRPAHMQTLLHSVSRIPTGLVVEDVGVELNVFAVEKVLHGSSVDEFSCGTVEELSVARDEPEVVGHE